MSVYGIVPFFIIYSSFPLTLFHVCVKLCAGVCVGYYFFFIIEKKKELLIFLSLLN
ncbi:hypothetical protein BDA99DRAFT_502732, partial [Phascolomyces articulosus]